MNPPVDQATVEAPPDPTRLPVFVSADGYRDRVLRVVGRAAAGLTALWLITLVAGASGLGRLPGLALPRDDHGATPPGAGPSSRSLAESRRMRGPAKGREDRPTGSHRRAADASPPAHAPASAHTPASGHAPASPASPASPGRYSAGRNTPRTGPARGSRPPTTGPRSSPTAPGRSETAPGTAYRGSGGEAPSGPPATAPAATRAEPSPSAMEHSRAWSSPGG
jgi:hypothetical protein